jgi:hypothetical protein
MNNKKVDQQTVLVKMDKTYIFKWRFVSEVQTSYYKTKGNGTRLNHHFGYMYY